MGEPSVAAPSGAGLYVSRTPRGDWRVQLISQGAPQRFYGAFNAEQTVRWIRRVSIEGGDKVTGAGSNTLNTSLETWGSGYDQFDFAIASDAGACLRESGGSNAKVFLGATQSSAVPVSFPVDITGSGACGTQAGSPPPPVEPPPPSGKRKYNSGHYISLMRGNDKQAVMADSMRAGAVGFKKRYTWRELEPSLGQYDFSEIASDLAYLSGQGMHLIVMIEDKTFTSEKPTPGYLQGLEYTRRNRPGGYTAVRWSPYVVARMKALVTALGQRFDSNPYFEGIATQESAPGLDGATLKATGYTAAKYRDALIDVLSHATVVMPSSRVFWMMNFLPQNQSYIGDVADAVKNLGVVLGGPDIMPDDYALQTHTYPFYHQFKGQMPTFGQVEPVCYSHMHKDTTAYSTKYWTMPELFRYGRDNLGTDYIFWVRLPHASPADSYDWVDAQPVIANNPVF
ncbi:hypothetical protein BH24PSE2_BH24PSE2_21090 [soil metagenome]